MQKRGPAMVERVVLSNIDELSLSYSRETIGNAYCGRTGYSDNDDSGNEFVFNIDPNLIIDPHSVKIGRVIGDGPYSIVYEGLWVPSCTKTISVF